MKAKGNKIVIQLDKCMRIYLLWAVGGSVLRLVRELLQTSFHDKVLLNRIKPRRYQLLLISKREQSVKPKLSSNGEN